MQIRKEFNFFLFFLYLLFGAAALFLLHIGNNYEPFALALCYALSAAGLSPALCALVTFLPCVVSWDLRYILLTAAQSLLVMGSFYLQRKTNAEEKQTTGLWTLLALSLSMGAYAAFAPFTPYALPFPDFFLAPLTQKVIIAAGGFLLSAVFSVALKALVKKFLRCRMRGDECVFSVLFLLLVGVGICRFLGLNAYMGIAIFVLLCFSAVTKDASSAVCAFALSIPPLLVAGLGIEKFFFYGVCVVLFIPSGRLAAVCGVLAVFFAFGYFEGLYAYPTAQLVSAILSALIPSLLFLLLPPPLLRELENKLVFYREKHLSRVAINRNRAAIGEKLYEISGVFREIQATFLSLGDVGAEQGAKEYIRTCVQEEACRNCPQRAECQRQNAYVEIDKLIDVGCLKGKTTLLDVPRGLAEHFLNQSCVLYAVNRQVGEYKKYMLEAENAASGRALLAKQAQGVSEILRNLALEQSQPLHIHSQRERELSVALLGAGILCSETLVYGEDDALTLSLVTYGNADVKKIAAVATHLLDTPMMNSEKIQLNDDKFCCILRKKPSYDAAFGVASMKKSGETVSGDTHSVVKIDERKFLVALADGMGSGEYAHKVAESTISLLESFYRANMPSGLVLSTVNKLLTFAKEESFACVNIAVVDLDEGRADVVKIGAPIGFILSGNTVKVLESASLPLGILETVRPDANAYALAENDVLLFLSDGIADAFGSATDLYEALRVLPAHNPQQLTDELLAAALRAQNGVAKDDMTALAVRLFKNRVA